MSDQEFLIDGFQFSAVAAGVKKADSDRLDFALILSEAPAVTVGVTTTNLVCAAPVTLARDRLRAGVSQAILMNSGNANAFTGEAGISDAQSLSSILTEKPWGPGGPHNSDVYRRNWSTPSCRSYDGPDSSVS